jgi:hypothetical protein
MLKRDALEPNRYEYLDEKDTQIYDGVENYSQEKLVKLLKLYIEEKARRCRAEHAASKY